MFDVKQKAKMNVLEEIMNLMDSKIADGMKSKSPKIMSAEISVDKPMDEDELKKKLMGKSDDEMSEEMPGLESEETDEDDEELEKLKEMYARLK